MSTETERLAVIENELKSIKDDIHTLFNKTNEINELNTNMKVLSNSFSEFKETMTKYMEKIEVTANEPIKENANKWNDIVKLVIAGVMGLGFGYITMKLGLSK